MDGKDILAARTARGQTQEQAANEIGITLRSFQRYEKDGCSSPNRLIRNAVRRYVAKAPEQA